MKLVVIALALLAIAAVGCAARESQTVQTDPRSFCTSMNVVAGRFVGEGSCREPATEEEVRERTIEENQPIYRTPEQIEADSKKADANKTDIAADRDALIEQQNADEVAKRDREVQREKMAARQAKRAAAKVAAQQTAAERAMDSHQGIDCIHTFGRYELDIRESLGWLQVPEFTAQRCSAQHKVLAYLGQFPAPERSEEFDRLMDAARR